MAWPWGGGCELCLVCDIRIASQSARFGQPEIRLGLIPAAGGTQRLPRVIGINRAKALLYTGDPIDAAEAYRIGLVNKVFPSAQVMPQAQHLAAKLSRRPTLALKILKSAVNQGLDMGLDPALSHETACFERLFDTEDCREGVSAFLEKRKPRFKGIS